MAANFPNSKKEWTPLVNGTTTDVSHVNTLYDEVTAVENTLLTGTDKQILSNVNGVPTWTNATAGIAVNVESITANKTLTVDDAVYQSYYTGTDWMNAFDCTVNLPTGNDICKMFCFQFLGYGNKTMTISYNSSVITKLRYGQQMAVVLWNGTTWIPTNNSGHRISIGEGANTWGFGSQGAIAIGKNANIDGGGIAIGESATSNGSASSRGIAIGDSSLANAQQISIGYQATGNSNHYGVAIGYQTASCSTNYGGIALGPNANANGGIAIGRYALTNSQNTAMVFGYFAKAQRWNEIHYKFDYNNTPNGRRTYSVLQWQGQTTDATQTEIFLGGTSNKRATVLAKSMFMYTIQVCALDSAYNAMSFEIKGSIKRDASNNTSLVGTPTVTTIGNSGSMTWSPVVEADDTNEALIIKVTGADATTVNWQAVAQITEIELV